MAVRDLDGMAKGQSADTHGVDYISAFYYRDQKRWRLCDSQYILDPSTPPRVMLPTLYLIGKDGKILHAESGAREGAEAQLETLIESALR